MKFLPEIKELPPDSLAADIATKIAQLTDVLKRLTDGRKREIPGRLRIVQNKKRGRVQYYHVLPPRADSGIDAGRGIDADNRIDSSCANDADTKIDVGTAIDAGSRTDAGHEIDTNTAIDPDTAIDDKYSTVCTTGKYIPQKDIEVAERLAQQNYDHKIEKSIEPTIENLTLAYESLNKLNKKIMLEKFSPLRVPLITTLTKTENDYIQIWQQQTYQQKQFASDDAIYFTQKNERVRSKSEIIIADTLCNLKIPYHYEYPVKLKTFNKNYTTLHPDFLVLNPHSREEFLWEHLGKLDDINYVNDALKRIKLYISNGIFPGRNLILTAETSSQPLERKLVENIINGMLRNK